MKNIQIGAALKTMRKNRGWTIHDVVVQLNDLYNIAVAEKTVYGWESDQAYPRTETLLLLCELYQSDTFTGNLLHIPADKSFPITADERHVIEMYRRHPEHNGLHRQKHFFQNEAEMSAKFPSHDDKPASHI